MFVEQIENVAAELQSAVPADQLCGMKVHVYCIVLSVSFTFLFSHCLDSPYEYWNQGDHLSGKTQKCQGI